MAARHGAREGRPGCRKRNAYASLRLPQRANAFVRNATLTPVFFEQD